MLTLKDFMETVDYRITEGGEYCWSCYGPDAYILSSYDLGSFNVDVIFDTKNQTVYEMTVCDYKKEKAYRRINPDFVEQMTEEAASRQVDKDQAWDDVKYIDVEESDLLKKAVAISAGEEYDL